MDGGAQPPGVGHYNQRSGRANEFTLPRRVRPIQGATSPPMTGTSHPPVILLASPTTTSSARQCMPRVHVLPPCVADHPIFYITCITRRQAPSCSFSPTSILRPLSLDHLPSSLLPITARLVSHSHWPIAFQSRTLGLLPGYPCVTMSPSIPVPPGPLSTAVPSS